MSEKIIEKVKQSNAYAATTTISEWEFFSFMDEIGFPVMVELGSTTKEELHPQSFVVDGTNEFCQPTGRMKAFGPETIDRMYEFIDTEGGLHYGYSISYTIEPCQGMDFVWLMLNGVNTNVYAEVENTEQLRYWAEKVEHTEDLTDAFARKVNSDANYALEFYLYGYNAPLWSETFTWPRACS